MAPAPLLPTPAPAAELNGVAASVKKAAARPAHRFDAVEDALAAFGRGEFVVVMDDEHRENEGDLIVAGAGVTTQQMAWMIKHTSGYICLALPGERLDALALPLMVPENEDPLRTAYAITVDYRHGTTTGISAHDRALTARQLAGGIATAGDFIRPGHLVPLRARPAGVLERRGHTEAGLDLCRLTGQPAAGLLAEIVNDDVDGTMARGNDCRAFADRWGLKMISIDMLARYRQQQAQQASA